MNKLITKEKLNNAFKQAWEVSEESLCLKKKVGALLINPITFNIVGKGYGGAVNPCETCIRKEITWTQDGCWSMHAEPRAIFDFFNQVGYNHNLSRFLMITTHGPCDQCLKYMSYFNIPLVIYDEDYHNDYLKWGTIINVHKRTLWEANCE